jgi:hypothetical protein
VQSDGAGWTLTAKSPQLVALQLMHERATVLPAGFVCNVVGRRSQYGDKGEDALKWFVLCYVTATISGELLLGDSSAALSCARLCSTTNVTVSADSTSVSYGYI